MHNLFHPRQLKKEQARISWPVILRWAQHLEDLAADFRRRVMAFATRVATGASARNVGKRKRNAFWPTISGLVYFNYINSNWNRLIISLPFAYLWVDCLGSGIARWQQLWIARFSSGGRNRTGIWYVIVRSSPRAPWLDGCIWQPERFVHANFSILTKIKTHRYSPISFLPHFQTNLNLMANPYPSTQNEYKRHTHTPILTLKQSHKYQQIPGIAVLKRKLFILFFLLFLPFLFPFSPSSPVVLPSTCTFHLDPASGFPSQRPKKMRRQRHVNDRKALICRWWSNGLGRGTFQTKNRGGEKPRVEFKVW